MKANKLKGFTLIELMIVIVVIGVLASIAIPSYQDYVTRSKRADAKSAILAAQLAQEKWRANNSTFTNVAGQASPDGYYTVTVTGASATGYTITAVPQGTQATGDTECADFTTDQDNTQTISGTGVAINCWGR
jgi:type IV pilus assembly protein PilE